MCSVAAAVAVGAQAVSTIQQQQQIRQQNRYQKIIHRANEQSANAAALSEFSALQDRQEQLRAGSAQDIARIAADARSQQATARVALLEGGGQGGNTADALLRDFERQEIGFQQNTLANLAAEERNIQREREAARARQAGRIASTLPNPVQGPFDSPLGILQTGLNLASAGIGAQSQVSSAGQAGATGIA